MSPRVPDHRGHLERLLAHHAEIHLQLDRIMVDIELTLIDYLQDEGVDHDEIGATVVDVLAPIAITRKARDDARERIRDRITPKLESNVHYL